MTTESEHGTVSDGTDQQVHALRPARKAYGKALLYSAPFPLGITVRNVLDGNGSWAVHVVSIGGSLLVIGVLLVLWFRVARVWTGDNALHKRNLFGRTRVVPHRDIASVLLVPRYKRLNAPVTTLVSFLDTDGRALLRLDGIHWGAQPLRSFAHATDAPVTELDGETKPKQLRTSHPRAIHWAERRPGIVWGATGGFCVLVIGFAVLARVNGWA